MVTLTQLRAQAKTLGATVLNERIGESVTCGVEAPHGFVWKGEDLHELVDSVYYPWKPDYADLLARMAKGVEPCPLGAQCEWCNLIPEE